MARASVSLCAGWLGPECLCVPDTPVMPLSIYMAVCMYDWLAPPNRERLVNTKDESIISERYLGIHNSGYIAQLT